MNCLANASIKTKLMVIIQIVSGTVLLLSVTAFVSSDLLSYRKIMTQDLTTLAELVGRNTSGALLFLDRAAAEENMQSLEAEPHIMRAYVFAATGEIFAQYTRTGLSKEESAPSLLPKNGIWPTQQYRYRDADVELLRPIMFDKEKIGTIYVQSDLGQWWDRLRWYATITGIVMVASLVLAFLLASQLQRIITTPICNLASTLKKVSERQDYSLQAKKTGEDELGTLIDGFNDMLAQIRDRNEELKQYQNQLEEQVEERTAQLVDARDQAFAASRAKSAFLANMSHEIRTPLNAVLGYAQILQLGTLEEAQRKAVRTIERSGNHLLGLINSILDLSKIEAGKEELQEEDYDLLEMIRAVADMFRVRCQQRGLAWEVRHKLQSSVWVRSDQGRLRQVLINLLGNAEKFTDQGKVSITITQDQEAPFYCFTVQDSGAGIPKNRQARLFDAFHQEQAGLEKGGTGLGLSIVKRQVELMGGSISFDSQVAKGTAFMVRLPLPPGRECSMSQRDMGAKRPVLLSGQPVYALVVDDVEENRMVLSLMLGGAGIEVDLAENGKEALEMIAERRPDIVFMDIRMPVMDGLETIGRIRAADFGESLICVAISASSLRKETDEYLRVGFDDFIAKPFLLKTLCQCVEEHLSVRFDFVATSLKPEVEEEKAKKPTPTVVPVSSDLHARLMEAAEFGMITQMQRLIDELKACDSNTVDMCEQISEYLDNGDFDGLSNWLEQVPIAA